VVELVTDCAPEFISTSFREWASQLGIDQTYSVTHEPVHNGAVERVIQSITRSTRQVLPDGALPARFWPEALGRVVWLYNRLPHASFEHRFSPFMALFHKPAHFHHLRAFGSLAFVKIWPPSPR
jgi:transposase InsO family protein